MASSSQLAVSGLTVILISTIAALFSLPVYSFRQSSLSMDIIHRYSKTSPLYEKESTLSSRLREAYERSYARARHFQDTIQSIPSKYSNLKTTVIPGSGEYLIKLGAENGTYFYANADTSSNFVWIQCVPCEECSQEASPLFNPSNSASYKVIQYDSQSCNLLPQKSSGPDSSCQYSYDYGDGSSVQGTLSSDTFILAQEQFLNIIFGCTHHTKGSFQQKGLGVVGLGGGPLSLIRQIGKRIDYKFSYCLPSRNSKGRIDFGLQSFDERTSKAVITTPLIPGSPATFYFLNLKEITVAGGEPIIMASTRPEGDNKAKGNIIIDSGTTLTLLDPSTLENLEKEVKSKVRFPQVSDPNNLFSLCFDISNASKGDRFPDITFGFDGNANVVLRPSNSFVKSSKKVKCLGFVSSKDIGLNIFGNIAQHNFRIGYDLKNNQLSLLPTRCA